MKHKIIRDQNIGNHLSHVTVQLIPENATETKAIINCEKVEASDSERELVDNYLLFQLGLGNYSVVRPISLGNNHVTLEVFRN